MSHAVAVESWVDSVAVYRSGALVTRIAELKEVPERIRIGPLPLAIDDGSVRVTVRGADGARPLASDLRVELEVPKPGSSLPPARPEEVETAEQRVAKLRDLLDHVRRDVRRIERIGVVARPSARPGREPPPSPAQARKELLDLRERRLNALDDDRDRLARELREAERRLADLHERERRASSARRAEPHELRKAAIIALRGGSAPATVELTYRVHAARWTPSYVLRLDPELSSGTLEVRALVAQRTDEDWTGVSLTLSTAELRGWAELPELPSLRIGRRQPSAQKPGWRRPPEGTDALFADFDRAVPSSIASSPAVPPERRDTRRDTPRDGLTAPGLAQEPPDAKTLPPPAPSPASIAAPYHSVLAAPMAGTVPAAPMAGAAPPPPAGARAPVPIPHAPPPGVEPAAARGGRERMFSFEPKARDEEPVVLATSAGDSLQEQGLRAIAAREEMLDYGRLRLPAAHSRDRGRLVLQSRRDLYSSMVRERQLEVDLSAAFGAADQRARALMDMPLPTGCRPIAPTGFDYIYRTAGRFNAPSDGVFHALSISAHDGQTRSRFVVVPRESREAYRYIEMDNPLDAPLLDGPIDVFVGDDFLATSTVHPVPPGGVLRLGLGVEQRLKVARNARFAEKASGLMGGRLDLEHQIEIQLSNQLHRKVDVEVRERVPVTREGEEDITVREDDVRPAWETWTPDDDELDGGRRWLLTLDAGEERTLTATYTIRISGKHELVGGNRREA